MSQKRCDGCQRRKDTVTVPDAKYALFDGAHLCDPCLLKVAKSTAGLKAMSAVVESFGEDGIYGFMKKRNRPLIEVLA